LIDLHFDNAVEFQPLGGKHLVEGSSLSGIAWKTVEDETVLPDIGLVQPLGDNPNDDVVGNEIATVHDRLGLLPKLGTAGDSAAQHFAGRKLLQPMTLLEELRLGALSGARRA